MNQSHDLELLSRLKRICDLMLKVIEVMERAKMTPQ